MNDKSGVIFENFDSFRPAVVRHSQSLVEQRGTMTEVLFQECSPIYLKPLRR